jgi:CBS domain-containing protein
MLISAILREKGHAVHTCAPDETVTAFAERLERMRVGALVVAGADGALVGVASERDVVRQIARDGAAALAMTVGDIMTRDVITVSPAETLDAALGRMTDRRIRHLPVVEDGRLVGLVSIGDLVKARIDAAIREAAALRDYIAAG